MFSHDIPRLEQKMEEAKAVLDESYNFFRDIIIEYKVKLETPYWDIACFLVYNKLYSTSIIDSWSKFWKDNSKHREFDTLLYQIPMSYYHFIGREEKISFFYRILKRKKDGFLLNWDSFFKLFIKQMDNVKIGLTESEAKVFLAILETQNTKNSILNKLLAMDSSNLSKYKKKVQDKGAIFEGSRINVNRLNLKIYSVLFHQPINNAINIAKFIPYSPFLRYIQRAHIGCVIDLVNYLLPAQIDVSQFLYELANKLHSKNPDLAYKIVELERRKRIISYNYRNFDFAFNRWNLEEAIESLYFKDSSASDSNYSLLKKEFELTKFKKISFSKLTIDVIDSYIVNSILPSSVRAQKLHIPLSQFLKVEKFLIEEEILAEKVAPMPIYGLANIIMFLKVNVLKHKDIHAKLAQFPEVYSEPYSGKHRKGVFFVIRVPHENTLEVVDSLKDVYESQLDELFIKSNFYTKRLSLPIERIDWITSEWKCSRMDILGG